MYIEKLDDLLKKKYLKKMKLVVVQAGEESILTSVLEAEKMGIVEPIFIGNKDKIVDILDKKGKNIKDYTIISELDLKESAKIGVNMVRKHEADFLMKGLVPTSILLKAVLDRDYGIRMEALLSHVMVYDVSTYSKLFIITDGGMNINPTVGQKSYILDNAVSVMEKLGRKDIKVALLAAKEEVDENMSATVDAQNLKDMFKSDKDVIVEGPMALDLAISKDAARIKGYDSPVSGNADILLVPNIEMGNGIGKAITYLAKGKSAGVIMGARAPIVLPSRSDSHQSKLYSIALGSIISDDID